MNNLDDLFAALARSKFRSRFKLSPRELAYLQNKTLPVILQHAQDFIRSRLAPANPARDGKQTPMRNHPVFVAQHATATCCRGCLQKWHGIRAGAALTDAQQKYIVEVIARWLREHAPAPTQSPAHSPPPPTNRPNRKNPIDTENQLF